MKVFSKKIIVWLQAMRVTVWFKGFWVVFALFGHTEISWVELLRIGIAILLVSLLSGAIYVNNDIYDVESDRMHPTKRYRPFASGELTVEEGRIGLMLLSLVIGALLLVLNNTAVTYLVFFMVIGNVLYTQKIKSVPYVELFYYGFLTAIRYWIGVAVIGARFMVMPSMFAVSLGLCMLALLRYMEKSRYGDAGRKVLKGYSLVWLQAIMIISGIVCAFSCILYGWSVSAWLVAPSVTLALYIARLIYLSMQKVDQPEKVDDLDKMLSSDIWLKILIVPYFLSVGVSILTSIVW